MYKLTTNELYHSGVKGQQWGKKNGPPYPLSASQHSSKEKKAGTSGWTKEAKQESRKKANSKKKNAITRKKKVLIEGVKSKIEKKQSEKQSKKQSEKQSLNKDKMNDETKKNESTKGSNNYQNEHANRPQINSSQMTGVEMQRLMNLGINNLTTSEIQAINSRMLAEKTYSTEMRNLKAANESAGEKFIKYTLNNVAKPVATTLAKNYLTTLGNNQIKKLVSSTQDSPKQDSPKQDSSK